MTEQAQKPKKKKKIWLFLLIAVVVIGVIVAVSGGGEEEKTATPVAVADLIDAYTSNEVSADQQYEDQYLEITGTIASIGTDLTDTPYITFNKGGMFETNSIQCFFSDDDQVAKVANLSEGQTITIRGTCSGLSLFNVLIKDCTIVE